MHPAQAAFSLIRGADILNHLVFCDGRIVPRQFFEQPQLLQELLHDGPGDILRNILFCQRLGGYAADLQSLKNLRHQAFRTTIIDKVCCQE